MSAGRLDTRITLQKPVRSKDRLNASVETFVSVATVWAAKVDASFAERVRTMEVGATVTARFLIRPLDPDLGTPDATWRVVLLDGSDAPVATYDIAGVISPQMVFGRPASPGEFREITATARAEV